MNKKLDSIGFNEDSHVLVPANGVGKLRGIKTIQIDGKESDFYNVYFEIDDMDVMIPVEHVMESGMRQLVSEEVAYKALDVLKKPDVSYKSNNSKAIQDEAVICLSSGSLMQSVMAFKRLNSIRRSFVNDGRGMSYRLVKLLDDAMRRVCGELSVVLKTEYKEMEEKIEGFLSASYTKKIETGKENDDFDDEFEEFEEAKPINAQGE